MNPYLTHGQAVRKKWDVGKERVSLDHANGMITLGESEVRAQHEHLALA